MTTNTQILLAQSPDGKLDQSHFEARTGAIPTIENGEVLVRNVLLSIDAANRAWMQGATYKSAVEQGQIMHGYAIGVVVESRSPLYEPGAVVTGELGWQEYAAMDPRQLGSVGDHRPLTHHHSVLGIAGITAYHGLLTLFGIGEEETLLVSAAAGSSTNSGSTPASITRTTVCRRRSGSSALTGSTCTSTMSVARSSRRHCSP